MPQKTAKVVVIGATYVDMALRCESIPSVGQSVSGSALSYKVTGPGPDQAVQAALCGCSVHLISKVGGDLFAQMVKDNLAEFEVNTNLLYTAEAKHTGTIVTLVNHEGENTGCVYCGANGALTIQNIKDAEAVIAEADICLIHGQLPPEPIIAAIKCAVLHGTKVILNPARPIERNGNEHSGIPLEYFSVNIQIPNLYEAAEITDHSEANIKDAKFIGSDLIARGVEAAVITMGKRGCMVVDRNGADHIPAFQVELVDQTCTGDAFAGALAAYCAVQWDLRKAVKFASAAGALACTKFGAIESLPTKAEILELLLKEEDTE